MRYLLDTNICVLLIRQKSQTVLQKLTQHPIADIAISAITVANCNTVLQGARTVQN